MTPNKQQKKYEKWCRLNCHQKHEDHNDHCEFFTRTDVNPYAQPSPSVSVKDAAMVNKTLPVSEQKECKCWCHRSETRFQDMPSETLDECPHCSPQPLQECDCERLGMHPHKLCLPSCIQMCPLQDKEGDWEKEYDTLWEMDGKSYERIKSFIAKEKQLTAEQTRKETLSTNKINRVEVIDHTKDLPEGGRVYVKWEDDIKVEVSFQDNDRTLKIFIDKKETK